MKKLLITLFLFVAVHNAVAQEGEDVGWVARFGLAGGFNPSFVFPNLDPLNAEVRKMGLSELSGSSLFLWGGGGYAYIMLIDNLRLGGIGIGGSTGSKGMVNGYNREVNYNFGLGGVTIEYTLPFIKHMALSVGAIIGAGSQSIEIYQNKNDFTWGGIWGKVSSSGILMHDDVNYEISNTFFTLVPTLNLDVPINRFVAVRLGGGYIFNFNESWKVNNDRNISGVFKELTSNNFFIQTGVYFGFFGF
ncbi:MAG: hypothetical protein RDU14_00090 [Melioribacteraceae bacterium]|nr:hypothetical protein [Melioribacteraceae bacterium]